MTKRVHEKLTLLEQVQVQSEVLVPVLRRLREELGAARANGLVAEALREWQRAIHERIAAETPGHGWAKLGAMAAAKMPSIGDAVTMEWETRDPAGAMAFNVTRCAYAEFFRALGEPELGALLTCESDVHEIAAIGNGVEFTRTQTIMQGASYCDFRYKMVKGAS